MVCPYFTTTWPHHQMSTCLIAAGDKAAEDNSKAMPLKKKTASKNPPPSPMDHDADDLAENMGKLRVAEPFSFDHTVPTMVKQFCKNGRDKVELELITMPFDPHVFKFSLSQDGNEATYSVATHEVFGEGTRMKV